MLRFKRGKRIDSGEWVVGFYVEIRHHNDDSHVHTFIMTPDKCIDNSKHLDFWIEVFPESVGDEIGGVSIDGIEIFEGDILQYFDNEIQVIEFDRNLMRMVLHTYGVYKFKKGRKVVKKFQDGFHELNDYPLNKMHIIGNAFDSSEIIERWRGKQCQAQKI